MTSSSGAFQNYFEKKEEGLVFPSSIDSSELLIVFQNWLLTTTAILMCNNFERNHIVK